MAIYSEKTEGRYCACGAQLELVEIENKRSDNNKDKQKNGYYQKDKTPVNTVNNQPNTQPVNQVNNQQYTQPANPVNSQQNESYANPAYNQQNAPYANPAYNQQSASYVNPAYNQQSTPYANPADNMQSTPYANPAYNQQNAPYANPAYNQQSASYVNPAYNQQNAPYVNPVNTQDTSQMENPLSPSAKKACLYLLLDDREVRFELKDITKIGRAAEGVDVDIDLAPYAGKDVSREHALIMREKDGYYIANISRNHSVRIIDSAGNELALDYGYKIILKPEQGIVLSRKLLLQFMEE